MHLRAISGAAFVAATLAGCCALGERATGDTSGPAPALAMAGGLFLFTYRPGPAWKPGAPIEEQGLGPHAAHLQRLVREGRAFAAGPFASSDGGMAVIVAPGMDEARAFLAADPAIESGIFVGTIEAWRPRFRTEAPLPKPD